MEVFIVKALAYHVIAEPNSEYEFLNWTGDIESSIISVNVL